MSDKLRSRTAGPPVAQVIAASGWEHLHGMSAYDVVRTDTTSQQVEADSYEMVEDDWVFYLGSNEVFRIPMGDVLEIEEIPNPSPGPAGA